MPQKPIDASTIVFSPGEARDAAVQAIRGNRALDQSKRGIRFGIPCLDTPRISPTTKRREWLLPLKRSELMTVIGRPRNGKTQLMMNTAITHAEDLAKAGVVDHATVFVSWEQSVEDLVSYDIARQTGLTLDEITVGEISDEKMELVDKYPIVRAENQLFFVGFSDTIQARRPPMTMDVIYQALETIRDWNGVKNSFALDLVVLDYLQRIPYDVRAESKTVGISKNVDLIKDLSLQFACGVIVGSQAKQIVETRTDKMPEASDSEYTDNLFQSSDKIVAVMTPSLYYEPGDAVAGMTLAEETLGQMMVVRVCKQKKGASEFGRSFLFDTSRCRYVGDVQAKEV